MVFKVSLVCTLLFSRKCFTPLALKWFPAGSLEPVDYQGGRDLDSLAGLCVLGLHPLVEIDGPSPRTA